MFNKENEDLRNKIKELEDSFEKLNYVFEESNIDHENLK